MGTAMKNTVPDRVKLSFVIFDIRALWRLTVGVIVFCVDGLFAPLLHSIMIRCQPMGAASSDVIDWITWQIDTNETGRVSEVWRGLGPLVRLLLMEYCELTIVRPAR